MLIPRASAFTTLILAAAQFNPTLSQTTAPRLISIAAPLNYEVQQERGSLQPLSGRRFIGVAFVKTDTVQVRFLADSAVLAASAGERMALAAFCSDSLGKDCIPIAFLRGGQVLGAYGENGEGYSLVRNGNTGVVTLARRGPRGTPFVLVYEVPVDVRQLAFSFGTSSPVTLTVPDTGGRGGGD